MYSERRMYYHMQVPSKRTTRHSQFNLNYHLVFTPKYRGHA